MISLVLIWIATIAACLIALYLGVSKKIWSSAAKREMRLGLLGGLVFLGVVIALLLALGGKN